MTTVLKVNGDGSGTIDHRMVYTKAALAQLKSFSSLGGSRAAAADPLSEQQAIDMTASIGPGVTYTSSELITTPLGQGRDTIYTFTDVSTLRISTQPAAPGGVGRARRARCRRRRPFDPRRRTPPAKSAR